LRLDRAVAVGIKRVGDRVGRDEVVGDLGQPVATIKTVGLVGDGVAAGGVGGDLGEAVACVRAKVRYRVGAERLPRIDCQRAGGEHLQRRVRPYELSVPLVRKTFVGATVLNLAFFLANHKS
jgi:hypothetical protein